jgi:hypothetical protein
MARQCASRLLFRHEEVPCAQFVHKKHGDPETLEEYLASVPEPARSTLNKVRAQIKEATIRSVVPAEITEVISYGIPAFKIEEPKYKGGTRGRTRGQTGRSPIFDPSAFRGFSRSPRKEWLLR